MTTRPTRLLTLSLVVRDTQVLLGLKKRGFGQGRWNGFGGKLEEGESILAAAKRELFEEAGLEAVEIDARGIIRFDLDHVSELLEVHVFYVSATKGKVQESDEMRPQWFMLEEIPFDEMWADDRHWFPLFLAGKKFRAAFHFDSNERLLEHVVEEVTALC